MRWFIAMSVVVFGAHHCFAQNYPPGIGPIGPIYYCNTYPCSSPNSLPTWDNRVFDFSYQGPGAKGARRYWDDQPAELGTTRKQWIKACRSERENGMEAFRRCFERKKAAASGANELDSRSAFEEMPKKTNSRRFSRAPRD